MNNDLINTKTIVENELWTNNRDEDVAGSAMFHDAVSCKDDCSQCTMTYLIH